MAKERTITLVDIIIDRHHRHSLGDILRDLKHARIDGHDVLHVLVKDTNVNPKDEVPIPHPYHSALRCKPNEPCMNDSIILEHAWLRNFNIQLVLDGTFSLVDQEVTDFELRHDVLIMLSCVLPVKPIPNHARFNLVNPWRK
jgi:hypothetical protein